MRLGYSPIKLNVVAVKGLIEPDIVPIAHYCRERGIEPRFIEFMPLDAQHLWDRTRVLAADEIIRDLSREVSPLIEIPDRDLRAPATEFAMPTAADTSALLHLSASLLPELQPPPPHG